MSNGNYHVMVTNTGRGYSRWKALALTRWREDSTCGNWGSFCYMEIVLGDPAADIRYLEAQLRGVRRIDHAPGDDAPIG